MTEIVRFTAAPEVFEKANEAFARLRSELQKRFPKARIEHVGSTALPGSLTKGDLDVQIIVSRETFAAVVAFLAKTYETNDGAFSSKDSASFKDEDSDPPVGLHVTVSGCPDDFQWKFRDLLLGRPDLRKEYDDLKRKFEGKPMSDYRKAKELFFERLPSR